MKQLSIEIKQKRYSGICILKDLNLSFPESGLFLIKGKNGSGKTTLLSMIAGLDTDFSGKLTYQGVEIHSKNADRYFDEHISYVPQNSLVFDDMTVLENVLLPYSDKDKEKATSILQGFGLDHCLQQNASSLSEGEKQRLALARSFYHLKDIVLLDEVTSSLDQENRDIIWRQIKEISRDHLVLFVTHETITDEAGALSGVLEMADHTGTLTLNKDNSEGNSHHSANNQNIRNNHFLFENMRRFRSHGIVTFLCVFLFSFISVLFGNLWLSVRPERISELTYQNYLSQATAYRFSKEDANHISGTKFAFSDTTSYVKNTEIGNKTIGNMVYGVFLTDSFEDGPITLVEGRYPSSNEEVIISDYCYEALGKSGEFVPFSTDDTFTFFSPYRVVVGVYKGLSSPQYSERKALLFTEEYGNAINLKLMPSYSFMVESAFSYGNPDSSEFVYMKSREELKNKVNSDEIKTNLLADPTASIANVGYEGDLPLNNRMVYGCASWELFAFVALAAIFGLFVILGLSFKARYQRQFILLRVNGVSRKRLTTDVLLSFGTLSGFAMILGMVCAVIALILMESVFAKRISLVNMPLFTNHILFFVLTFLVIGIGIGFLALILYRYLTPKNNEKQLLELKSK